MTRRARLRAVASATATALGGRSDIGHTHSIANVSGLQTALDGKAASSHTHTASQITDFAAGVAAAIQAGGTAINSAFQTILAALGSVFYNMTVTGIQTSDNLVECIPTGDLPSNLVLGQPRISGANTVRLQLSSGVLYTGNPNIGDAGHGFEGGLT